MSPLPRKPIAWVLGFTGFALLGGLAYQASLFAYFVADDFLFIEAAREGVASIGVKERARFVRPLVQLSFLLDYLLWGQNSAGYHFSNLLLHTANSLLVSGLTLRLLELWRVPFADSGPRVAWVAWGAGLYFLLLPSHSESVAWISGRSDVIATLFGLMSLIAGSAFLKSGLPSRLLSSLLCLALALFAKEVAVVLPLVSAAIAGAACYAAIRTPEGAMQRRALKLVGAQLALLAGYVALRWWWLGSPVGGYGLERHASFARAFSNGQLWTSVLRSFLPPLSEQTFEALEFTKVLPPLALGALVIAAVRRRSRSALAIVTLAVCYALTLAPGFTMGIRAMDLRGERFLYLPTVFTCALVPLGLALLPGSRSKLLWWPLMVALLAFSGASLWRVNQQWFVAGQLTERIASDIVAQSERSDVVVLNVPDHINGAYVFRSNALPSAVAMASGWSQAIAASRVTAHNVNSPESEVTVRRDGSDAMEYRLELVKGEAFRPIRENHYMEVVERSGAHATLRFRKFGPCPDVFYYSRGGARRLETSCPRRRDRSPPDGVRSRLRESERESQ